MKKTLLSTFGLLFFVGLMTSCKGEKNNETEASEAEEVAEVAETASSFMVQPNASMIEWSGSKPTGKHNGTVQLESGVIKVMDSTLSGTFLIDMTTIDVEDLEGDQKASLEAHLKGTTEGKEDHFFNVENYPDAAFEITGVTKKEGKTMVSGNLTIKDQKKNIEFPATYEVNGDTMTFTSEPFTIDRTNWNVNYGSKSVFDNLGDQFVSDDIELTVKLKAAKKM
ncbi:MAG: YceI family protein [Leeuwenhoekiella sp.]